MGDDHASLYSYDQWDEDNVDLSFQTVPDLLHLLPDRDDQLDHHLYQQAVILHALLRKVGLNLYKQSGCIFYFFPGAALSHPEDF